MSDMQDICYSREGSLDPQWVGTHKLRTTSSPRCLLGPWLRLAESELAVQRNEVLACPGDSRGSLKLKVKLTLWLLSCYSEECSERTMNSL